MDIAGVMSSRSTCDRASVGAVIARDGRILSTGYNGAPPGLPHCEENNHGWPEDPDEWPEFDPWYKLVGI